MNQDFLDYEASYITPQKTLLKKLNEVLKYLKEHTELVDNGSKIYKHNFTFANGYNLSFFDNDETNDYSLNSAFAVVLNTCIGATLNAQGKNGHILTAYYNSTNNTFTIYRVNNTGTVEAIALASIVNRSVEEY